MTSKTLYMIRDPNTGLFSTGGTVPDWNTAGKVWKRRGDLSSHFTNLCGDGRRKYRDANAEVVEMEMVITNAVSVSEYINASDMRAADRKKAEQEAHDRFQRQRDIANLKRLQTIYGKDPK